MREPKKIPSKQNRADPFLKLTGAQLVCCGLILGLVFGAMKLNAPLFERLRAEFHELNAVDIDPGSFRFFDFGSAGEKQDDGASTAEADDTATTEKDTFAADETPAEEENSAFAGGEDLADDEALRAMRFSFYESDAAVVMPVNGRVSSPFGERVHPIYGTQGFHSGQDIAAPEGTPVYAAMDGEVIAVGVGEMSGNYVKLSHAEGMETLYCHLCAANVEEGVAVRRGDVIGFVGQTGLATGPHLHFEVHIDGVKRDPAFLLEDAAVVS